MPAHLAAIESSLKRLHTRFEQVDDSDGGCWWAIRFEPPLPTQTSPSLRKIDRDLKERPTETTEVAPTPRPKQDVVPPSLRLREFKHVPVPIAYTWEPKMRGQQRLTGFCFGDLTTWKRYKAIGDDLTEVLFGMSDEDRAQLAGHDGWSAVAGVIRKRTRINDLPNGRKTIHHNKPNTWLEVLYEMSVRQAGGLPSVKHLSIEHVPSETAGPAAMAQRWTAPVRLKPTCIAMTDALLRPLHDIVRDSTKHSPGSKQHNTGGANIQIDSADGDARFEFAEAERRTASDLSTTAASQPSQPVANHAARTEQSGVPWKVAREKAEEHVKSHHGAFPSVSCLAKIIGCSRRTIDKAVKNSTYLSARKAEAKAAAPARMVGLSEPMLDVLADEDRNRQLEELVDEQAADARRDVTQARARKTRR